MEMEKKVLQLLLNLVQEHIQEKTLNESLYY